MGLPRAALPAHDGRGRAEPYGISRARVEAALCPEELEAQVDGIRKLHANGVRFVAGGDFGREWTRHGTYAAGCWPMSSWPASPRSTPC